MAKYARWFRWYASLLQYAAGLITLTQDTVANRVIEEHFDYSNGNVIWSAIFCAAATGLLFTRKLGGIIYFTFPIAAYAGMTVFYVLSTGVGYMLLLFALAVYIDIQIIWWLLAVKLNNHV